MKRLCPMTGQVRREARVRLLNVSLQSMTLIGKSTREKRWQTCDCLSSENNVDVRNVLANPIAIALRDAATNGDHALATRGLRRADHSRNLSVQTSIRLLPNATRHINDYISLVRRCNLNKAS